MIVGYLAILKNIFTIKKNIYSFNQKYTNVKTLTETLNETLKNTLQLEIAKVMSDEQKDEQINKEE